MVSFFQAGGAWMLLGGAVVVVLLVLLALRLADTREKLRKRLSEATSQISGLAVLSRRDALTGLMSRAEFEAWLEPAVRQAESSRQALAVLYVGLDNFRAINDTFGMPVGDALLRQVGQRLSAFVDDAPQVARASGDEFVLLLEAPLADAADHAAQLLQVLTLPFVVQGDAQEHTLQIAASIGVAVYPDHGARPQLMPHAALAMRSVKLGGGRGHAVYNPAMSLNLREQTELLQDLRMALARHELALVYQPKVDAQSLQITAAEALLRWQHPQRGLISPAVFVPLAERHGLIGEIGLWVIEEACRQAAQWRESGLRMRIAVNISGHQLRRDDLVQQIEASLKRHQIPAERLTCEITETVAMEDTAVTRAAFERLRRAGLHVSIDDFGTGHSSLASLRRLPAAELKVDRAFVTDLASCSEARSIVRAVVQMAHSLGLRVVAEGVETESQRDVLIELGCDELQGYLFAKPMSAAALALWAEGEGPPTGAEFRPSLFEPTAPAPLT